MADTTETTEGHLQEGEVTSPILAEGLTTQHEERVENTESSTVSSVETPAVSEAVAEPEPDSETPLKGFMNDYSNEETDEERSEDEDQGDVQTVASPTEDTFAFALLSPPLPAPTTPSSDALGLFVDETKEKEEGEKPVDTSADTAPAPTLMDDEDDQQEDEDVQQEEDEQQEEEEGVSGSSEEDVVQLESEGGSPQDSEQKEQDKEKDDQKSEDSNSEEEEEDSEEDEDDSQEKDADPLDTLKKLASEAKPVDQQAFPRDTVGLSGTQGAPRPTVGEKKPLFSTQPRHLPIFSDSDSASDEDSSSDGSQQVEEVDSMSDDGADHLGEDEDEDEDDDDAEMQVPATSRPSSSSVTLHATTTPYEPQEIDEDDDESDDQEQEEEGDADSDYNQKQAKHANNADDPEDLDDKDNEEDEEIEGSDEEEDEDDDLDGLSEPFSQAKRTVGKKWARAYESPAASHLQKKRARLDSASPSDSSPSEDQDKVFGDQYEDDEDEDEDQVPNKHQRRAKEAAFDDGEEEDDDDEWEAVSSDLEPLQDRPIQTTSFRERPSLKDLLDDYDEDDEVFGLAEDDQIGDVQSSDDLSDSEEEVGEDGEEYEDSDDDEPPQRSQSAFASASQNKFANYNRQTGRNVIYQYSAPAPAPVDGGVIDLDSDSEDDAPPPAPQQQQTQQRTADSESEYEDDDDDDDEEEEEEEETTQKPVAPPSQPQAPQSAPNIEVDRVAGSQIIANLDKKHQDIVNLIAQKEKETKRYKTFVRLSSFLDGHKAGNLLPREGNTTDLIKVTHYLLQLIAAKTASIQEEIETNRVVKNLLEDVQEYQGKLIATQCLLKTKKTEMEDKANRLRVCDLLLTTISLIKDFQQKQAKRKATTPTRPLSSSLSRSVV